MPGNCRNLLIMPGKSWEIVTTIYSLYRQLSITLFREIGIILYSRLLITSSLMFPMLSIMEERAMFPNIYIYSAPYHWDQSKRKGAIEQQNNLSRVVQNGKVLTVMLSRLSRRLSPVLDVTLKIWGTFLTTLVQTASRKLQEFDAQFSMYAICLCICEHQSAQFPIPLVVLLPQDVSLGTIVWWVTVNI